MTPDERIAQLEAALALERAKVHELSAALAAAVASAARVQQLDAERKARRSEQNRKAYTKRQQPIQHEIQRAESGAEPPSPSLPPPSSSPSLPEPISPPPISSPNPSSPPSASQEPADAAPFALEAQEHPKGRKRQPSAAERLYASLEASRRTRCEEVGEPFIPENWPAQRQNTMLGPLIRAAPEEQGRLEVAWGLYLGDDGQRVRTPAWSLGYFLSSGVRAKYETLAAREGET